MNRKLNILGLMSGTSLDGLDMALCHFNDAQHFQLLAATTIPYPDAWQRRLASLHQTTALEYIKSDSALGHWMGQQAKKFLNENLITADCIASHGHTIFHQPQNGFTSQIGDPNAIYAETGIPVVSDFRRLDVALGGQGAPLVPIGDRLLFSNYDCCINLGGIANLSYENGKQRIAFDISPCNMALNYLAAKVDLPYDRDGQLAQIGELDTSLLEQLESLDYYRTAPPKTLGKEWFEACFLPLIETKQSIPNLLRTVSEHIALRIAEAIPSNCHQVLITGGGAHNKYIINLLRHHRKNIEITIPHPNIIDFKESIIFALLAYLRLQGQINTLASVTGATRDSCGGTLCGTINP